MIVTINSFQIIIGNWNYTKKTYRMFEEWEREDLISNLVADLSNCDPRIQDKIMTFADEADEDYGRRLREGLA